MMKKSLGYLILGITLILSICLSGCVAPPAEQKIVPVDNYDPNQFATTATTAPMVSGYVTIETPYVTSEPVSASNTTEPKSYSIFTFSTPIPEDITCLIYSTKQSFLYNTTAFSFDLKNPPMYIKFNVTDYPLIKKTKVVTARTGSKAEETVTYTIVDPTSFFEIIVRDKNSGEIYVKEGFGKDYGYHDGSIKVNENGNLLLEMTGNRITSNLSIYVKPIGNFNDTSKFNNTECIYWTSAMNL